MASRFHILIVEDEPLVVEVLQATLEPEAIALLRDTVGEALAFLRTGHVDVVLVDNVLPDGRGTEVVRLAAELGAAIIEMSGYPEVMNNMQHSSRPHLFKPFKAEVLLSTIGNALSSHE